MTFRGIHKLPLEIPNEGQEGTNKSIVLVVINYKRVLIAMTDNVFIKQQCRSQAYSAI